MKALVYLAVLFGVMANANANVSITTPASAVLYKSTIPMATYSDQATCTSAAVSSAKASSATSGTVTYTCRETITAVYAAGSSNSSSAAASSSSSSSRSSSGTSTSSSSSVPLALNHVALIATPAISGGPGTEWVNGETRLIKDKLSGDLLGFMWSDSVNKIVLIASQNNGLSWTNIASISATSYRILAVTQDSVGQIHMIGSATIADSGYYLRATLTYTNGHVSGALLTNSGFALPNHRRVGTELRADIKIIMDISGRETVAYAINMATMSAAPVTDIKVYMARATSLTPSSFINLSGGAGDSLIFDSCTYAPNCSGTNGFSTHVHSALFAQNMMSKDLYLIQGPINADYGISYGGASDWITYTRLTPTASGWTVASTGTVSTNIDKTIGLAYASELFSVASGTNYAWVMYNDPLNGIRFGRFGTSGSYSDKGAPSPVVTKDRNGWGVFSVSADDTKIWAIWDTLNGSGGGATAAEGYFNGSTWTIYNDVGANSMGMAGVCGFKNGVAALLFTGNVQSQTYQQPVAASIWSN